MTLQRLLRQSCLLVRRLPVLLITAGVGFILITTNAEHRTSRSHLYPSAALVQNRERVEAELITIEPHGFEPARITRSQGRFLLGIDNRSGLENIQLRLERAEGGRVPALEARNRRLSWREEVDLPPGQYVIRATNQHEWSCLITITSR